jgi:hypothetical protein
MGIKLKKHGAKWHVYVTHNSVRKAKCVGTHQAAEEVRRQLEARFALGDTTFLCDGGKPSLREQEAHRN